MAHSKSSLYRQQAIQHAGRRALGNQLIAQPLSLRILTFLLLLITAIVLIYLQQGEYARKETVPGFLRPEGGISRVFPTTRGIAEKLLVKEGEWVKKEQSLLRIQAPNSLANGEDAPEKILQELHAQQQRLLQKMDRQRGGVRMERDWRTSRLESLQSQWLQLKQVSALQRSRTRVAEQQLSAVRQMKEKGFISRNQWLQTQANFLDEKKESSRIAQQLTQTRSDIATANHQLAVLPDSLRDRLEQLQQQVSDLEQRIIDIRRRSGSLVKAPIAGTVTAINVSAGEPVTDDRPLLTIVPRQSPLFAWLLVPSRAAGFVATGQRVRLMFDSFPYQQFGTQPGIVVLVSGAVTNPNDRSAPLHARESVFMVKVALQKSTVTAFGKEAPLQPDMLLSADIVLARRSILDWMLEPLHSLWGRTS